jgi:hypothetical protein
MGRWSQARRRGGGGPVPTAAASIQLLSVAATGPTTYTLTFNAPVTTNGGDGNDPGFQVATQNPNAGAVGPATGLTVDLEYGDGASAGQDWVLASQPGWLTTSVDLPAAGTTT